MSLPESINIQDHGDIGHTDHTLSQSRLYRCPIVNSRIAVASPDSTPWLRRISGCAAGGWLVCERPTKPCRITSPLLCYQQTDSPAGSLTLTSVRAELGRAILPDSPAWADFSKGKLEPHRSPNGTRAKFSRLRSFACKLLTCRPDQHTSLPSTSSSPLSSSPSPVAEGATYPIHTTPHARTHHVAHEDGAAERPHWRCAVCQHQNCVGTSRPPTHVPRSSNGACNVLPPAQGPRCGMTTLYWRHPRAPGQLGGDGAAFAAGISGTEDGSALTSVPLTTATHHVRRRHLLHPQLCGRRQGLAHRGLVHPRAADPWRARRGRFGRDGPCPVGRVGGDIYTTIPMGHALLTGRQ